MDVLLKHLTDDAEQGKYYDSCLLRFFPLICVLELHLTFSILGPT